MALLKQLKTPVQIIIQPLVLGMYVYTGPTFIRMTFKFWVSFGSMWF